MDFIRSSQLIVAQLLKKFSEFMKLGSSLSFQMSPKRAPVQSHMNPIHILLSCYFKDNFNNIRRLSSWSPVCPFHSGFPTNICMYFSTIPCVLHARLFHSPSFYHHNIRREVQIMKLLPPLLGPSVPPQHPLPISLTPRSSFVCDRKSPTNTEYYFKYNFTSWQYAICFRWIQFLHNMAPSSNDHRYICIQPSTYST
jgi:hypothetical protein